MAFSDYLNLSVNFFSIFLAAVAYFLLGMFWYSETLFGSTWKNKGNIGVTKFSQVRLYASLICEFILDLVTALVLSLFIAMANTSGSRGGMLVGLWAWIGFTGAPQLLGVIWSHKSFKSFLIHSGFVLIGLLLMGAIIGYINDYSF
jgi:hypothetical protein